MNKRLILVIALLVGLGSNAAFSAVPTCYESSGGYCKYRGKVAKIYVNSGNLILIYFDTPMALDEAASIGLTITNGGAAAYKIDTQPEFAKLFYSTALAAQASGREVNIQMRGVLSGFLMFDRIWLAEE